MKRQKLNQKLISKVASKKALDKNTEALKYYNHYKKTADLLERTSTVLGRKPIFKMDIGSTLNFEINYYGVSSTTAQKI